MSAEILNLVPKEQKDKNRVYVRVEGCDFLVRNTRNNRYYVRKYVDGKGEIFKSTKTDRIMKAKTIGQVMLDEFRGREPGLRKERAQIADLCGPLLEGLEEQTRLRDEEGLPLRRESTYYSKDIPYLRGEIPTHERVRDSMAEVGVMRQLFGKVWADEIDEQWWKDWVKYKGRKAGRNLTDVSKYLSMILTYAFEQKYIPRKPAITYKAKSKKKVVYSDQEILLFFEYAEPTLQDLIVLASENPIRPHEAYELRWDFLTLGKDETGRPIVTYSIPDWFAKIGEGRGLELSENSYQVLKRRKAEIESPFVFPAPKNDKKPMSKKQMSRMWARMKKRMAEEGGIEIQGQLKFHWFRHSVYTKLLRVIGMPVAQVSDAGGTSIRTLERNYLQNDSKNTRAVTKATKINFTFGKEEKK